MKVKGGVLEGKEYGRMGGEGEWKAACVASCVGSMGFDARGYCTCGLALSMTTPLRNELQRITIIQLDFATSSVNSNL